MFALPESVRNFSTIPALWKHAGESWHSGLTGASLTLACVTVCLAAHVCTRSAGGSTPAVFGSFSGGSPAASLGGSVVHRAGRAHGGGAAASVCRLAASCEVTCGGSCGTSCDLSCGSVLKPFWPPRRLVRPQLSVNGRPDWLYAFGFFASSRGEDWVNSSVAPDKDGPFGRRFQS